MRKEDKITDGEKEGTLLLRYVRGLTSDEENKEVESWIGEDEANEKAVTQIANIYYAQRTKARIENRDSRIAYEKVQLKQNKRNRRIYLRRAVTVAASILLVLSLGFNTFLWKNTSLPETQYITLQTNAGMRTNLTLPDGTLVYLNSASKITYPVPYDPKERKVLLEGEGYFEVKSNLEQPFIVSVADDRMRIKVLGTSFNINAYPEEEEIYTTLVEGSVVLQYTDTTQNAVEQKMETESKVIYHLSSKRMIMEERELVPSEKATYNLEAKTTTIQKVNTANEYAWKDGKLIFRNTPMPEVLNKLSNFYNVKFEVKNPVINSYPFTGTFDNKQLSQVLDYFRHTSKINYTIRQVTEDDSDGIKYTTVILDK